MHSSTRLGFTVVLLAAAAAWNCGPSAPIATPVTTAEQVAAMELGFGSGSLLAQVALPVPLRKESFGGFARADADLRGFMQRLAIPDADAASAAASLGGGFSDPNAISGAQRILDGMNLVKERLSAGAHPELMRVYRIGMVIGYTLETAVVVTRGNPKPEHLQTFAALTGRYRTALPEDLAQAGLPADLSGAVRRTAASVQSTDDLRAIVGECLSVKDFVEKMKAGGQSPK